MTKPTDYSSIPVVGSQAADLRAIRNNLDLLTGRAGTGMHRALTPEDLQGLPGISLSRVRGAGGGHIVQITPSTESYATPPRPTNVVASGAFSHIFIGWDRPNFSSFAYAEIFRSETDDFGTAVSLATTTRNLFADPVDFGSAFYYWVRFVNLGNTAGPIHATAGAYAESAPNILAVMQELSEEINESYLAQTLRARIDLIDLPDTGLIDRLQSEVDTRISEVNTLTIDLVAETNQRLADILAIDLRIDSSDANILANEQDITQLQIDLAAVDGDGSANASAIDALDIRVTQNEDDIVSQATQITNLSASITAANNAISGNADGISALDVRVTSNEGEITSQATQITNLSASISSANNAISGNADGISALDARVTSNEGEITSQATQISNLTASLATTDGNVTGNANAISSIDTRVANAEGEISSHSTQLTNLSSSITTANNNISGNPGAISAIDARVTTNEDGLTSQASDITSINSALATTNSNVSSNASGLSSLTTRVTSNENELTSVGSQITQIESDIAAIESGGSGNSSAISALDTRVTANEGDISTHSSQITTLQTDVSSALSNASSNSSAISALDSRIDATESSISSQSSQITTLNNSVTTAQVAAESKNAVFYGPSSSVPTATGVDDVWYVSDLGNLPRRWNGSSWVSIQDTAIAANSTAINTLDSRVDTAEGNIVSQGSAVTALQNSVTDLESDTSSNATAISSIDTRVTSAEGNISSQATSILQLQSDVGDNTSTIQQLVSVTDGLDAMWAVSANVGTLRAGFGLRIDQSGSEFIVDAGRFSVRNGASEINPFIVNGSDTYISTAFIQDGWITNAHVGNLTTDAITGLNASFIQANIGTLYVDQLEGDVNKIYKGASTVAASGLADNLYRSVLTITVGSQTRPRFPVVFTELELESSTTLSNRPIGLCAFRKTGNSGPSDFTCTMPNDAGISVSLSISGKTLTISDTLPNGSSIPADPANWENMSECEQITASIGGRFMVFKPIGNTISGTSSSGPSNFTYFKIIPFEWQFQKSGSSFPNVNSHSASGVTFSCWNSNSHYAKMSGERRMTVDVSANEPRTFASAYVEEGATASATEYYLGVEAAPPITCTESQMHIMMVR